MNQTEDQQRDTRVRTRTHKHSHLRTHSNATTLTLAHAHAHAPRHSHTHTHKHSRTLPNRKKVNMEKGLKKRNMKHFLFLRPAINCSIPRSAANRFFVGKKTCEEMIVSGVAVFYHLYSHFFSSSLNARIFFLLNRGGLKSQIMCSTNLNKFPFFLDARRGPFVNLICSWACGLYYKSRTGVDLEWLPLAYR